MSSKYKVPGFISRDKDSLLYSGSGEFIFYVPENFFTTKNAYMQGEYVTLLGILNYSYGDNKKLQTFNFPSVFMTKPSSMEKVKNIKLNKYDKSQDYRLFKYKKGDQIVVNTKIPQDIKNVEDFYQLFLINGNIPTTIPYNKLHEYFPRSIGLNGSNYDISLQLFGIIISEMCRSVKDINIPFRLSKSNDMNEYTPINIKTIPKLASPYSSFTSENFDEAVINAALKTDNIKTSPMEKILMS